MYVPYEGLYGKDTPSILDIEDESNNTPDLLMNAEVLLPFQGREILSAQAIGRSKDQEGNTKGTYAKNRYLGTRTYDVMFPDGSVPEYAANIITEIIHSQIDDEGHRYQILDHIFDHKIDSKAIKRSDAWIKSKNGNKSRKHTTNGWYFEAQWRDGTSTWVPLKYIEKDNPIIVAEYCQLNDLVDEPAIVWWAPHMMKKTDQIIAKVKYCVQYETHKYGIQVPTSVREAYLFG